jgi:hypothetical protein
MGRLGFAVAAVCLAVQLSGCAAPAALESQSKPRDGRVARMYFLRDRGPPVPAEIKIDHQVVGTVVSGYYFFVDRLPGKYLLSSGTSLSMAYEAEMQVEAGQSYYFGIGVPQGGPPVQDFVNQAYAGSSGQQLRPTSPLMGGFSAAALYQIDPASGAAIVGQLKPQ